MFSDKGQKCENNPNVPLGCLEVIICGEYQAQNSNI